MNSTPDSLLPDDEVILERRGALGIITLNRPQALNALTLEMIRPIAGFLREWEQEDGIEAVFIRGAGERAFCSGGDLKLFYSAGMSFRRGTMPRKVPATFFAEEYSLNRQIFHYQKPIIAFMDGITMGGGYGLAGHARHRIATARTVFAMPETTIGFFPDIGSMYPLTRCPHNMGRYLALTASHAGPGDMLAAGLADYYIPATPVESIIAALKPGADIGEVLRGLSAPPPESPLDAQRSLIRKAFAPDSLADIGAALEQEKADGILKVLDQKSPASLAVTLRHYTESVGAPFDQIIRNDFVLAQRFLERTDFYEGIRAAMIDRDRAPRWSDDTATEFYFTPTGYDLGQVRIFR